MQSPEFAPVPKSRLRGTMHFIINRAYQFLPSLSVPYKLPVVLDRFSSANKIRRAWN